MNGWEEAEEKEQCLDGAPPVKRARLSETICELCGRGPDLVPWAKVNKKGIAQGSKCATCTKVAKQAWPVKALPGKGQFA